MSTIAEQKCPSCGAAMRFDPTLGKLVCDYCGGSMEIPQERPEEVPEDVTVQGIDFDTLQAQVTDANAENLPIYICVSCSAEVIAPQEQFALTCPYCGNNIVLTNKIAGKLRPNGVIPFKIDKKHLPESMTAFYKDKKLLPKRFFSESAMSKVTGVYVPFWIFDGRLSGVMNFSAERSSTHRSGDYEVTETSHFRVGRDVDLTFANVPVDASGRIEDRLMDAMEPFGMEEAKPFDMRYLAGFTADRFDLEKDDVAPRAEQRMAASAERAVSATLAGEYSNVRRLNGELRAALNAKYMLLPVYLFSIQYGGKSYPFAVNGQTGRAAGDVPTDKKVSLRYFLLRMGVVAAAVAAFMIIRYLLGR